ncbi:MAG: hypothetical protein ACK5PP_00790 [Acidimicrobiales bacterium]
MGDYKYRNLTSAIRDKESPLRRHLDSRFPNRRGVQDEYRNQCGSIVIDGGNASPGTVGTAFDLQTRLEIDPSHTPIIAYAAFCDRRPLVEVIDTVADVARGAAESGKDPSALARASWALAITTEAYRAGIAPGTPLYELLDAGAAGFTSEALLALAPDNAIRQLSELSRLAATNLRPHLDGPYQLGPTFKGSTRCPADADLIADGLLLEIKTRLGTRHPSTRVRRDALTLQDLYQLTAYALFDTDNQYGIDRVAVYSARYGFLISWPLNDLLNDLAGQPVDLEAERATVWHILDS